MTEWRTIEGFPDYQISDDGRVKSLKYGKERIMKTSTDASGHLNIGLSKKCVRYNKSIHRLMADAFIPNPDNLPVVRHLNDIPDDNRIENLAWGTQKDNAQDSIRNGTFKAGIVNRVAVVAINNIDKNDVLFFKSYGEAAGVLNTTDSHISECVSGKRKTAAGYHYKKMKPRHIGKPKNRR